ncbi:Cell wall-active antibiotics response 4TMS YvqF [Ligilactobacillus sp. WC1T17]|uniref:Cell wall-active antibiotics response 4TMS YvqF n=1 Tax=Ligilactobacillus ruminis TaxID=1623 RepID=A0ABY1AAF2_9LACO|nr:Cell wall-active antibiotics response 4TMS YvqF [Ligilactobacillus ruminis]
MEKRVKQILIGLFLLVAAGSLIASQMHLLPFTFSVGKWILIILLVIALIYSFFQKSISGTVFSIAFLLMVFAKELKITQLVPWTLLIAAVLVTIALKLILGKHEKVLTVEFSSKDDNDFLDEDEYLSEEDSDQVINIQANMAAATKYVRSHDLRNVNISATMAGVKLYLTEARLNAGYAVIEINANISDLDIYLPKTWQVIFNPNNILSEITTKGSSQGNEVRVEITGTLKLCDLTIHYI